MALFKKEPKSPPGRVDSGKMDILSFIKKAPAKAAEKDELTDKLNNLNLRIRVIDDRHNNLRAQIQFNEEQLIKSKTTINAEIKALDTEIGELQKDFLDINEKIDKIIAELKTCAKAEDLKVVEKYLELWQPLEFVTRAEAKKLVK